MARLLWSLTKWTAFLAVLLLALWLLFQNQVHSKLLATLQSKCDTALVGTGIEAQIGNAQFLEGRGMLLANVNVTTDNVSLAAYETFLEMPGSTTDLVIGSCSLNAIHMKRVKFQVFRDPNQSLDLAVLTQKISQLLGSESPCHNLVPLHISDSVIQFVDRATGAQQIISDFQLDVIPTVHEGRLLLQIQLLARNGDIQEASVNVLLDPESLQWKGQLVVSNARVRTELVRLLPAALQQKLALATTIDGRINSATLDAEGILNSGVAPKFNGFGTFSELTIDHRKLPAEIRNAYADFEVNNFGLAIKNLFANIGPAQLTGAYQQTGLSLPTTWQFNGKLKRFSLDGSERMMRIMSESGKRFCNEFQPRGRFDFDIQANFDGNQIHKTITADVQDLAFNYFRFPYPVSNGQGTVKWIGDQIEYDLRVVEREREVRASGSVSNPGPAATYRCDLEVVRGKLPFDGKLQTALDANPTLGKVVREFNAHGWVGGRGTIEKLIPGGRSIKTYDIDLIDLSILHKRFPYPINGVRGKIKTKGSSFTFENLTGSNGMGRVLCNGSWNPQQGLAARYICNKIQLDEHLRRSLRDELKEVWDGFRPRGTVELMTVDMTLPPGTKDCNLEIDTTLHSNQEGIRTSNISIFPTWFPYELEDLAGTIHVGNGKVALREFRGRRGRTTVACTTGDGAYSKTGWHVVIEDLLASSLPVDDPLLRAMPKSLAKSIQYLKFDGLMSVQGKITLAGQYRQPAATQLASLIPAAGGSLAQTNGSSQPLNGTIKPASATSNVTVDSMAPNISMGWDVSFNMNRAKMFLGIPVRNVFGTVKLLGQYDGQNVECSGDLDIDSLTIYEAQVTNVKGPIWFDNYQALAGGLINQLSNSSAAMPSIAGDLFGGKIKLNAAISSDEEGRFLLETEIRDADLSQVCEEFAPQQKDIAGRTHAALRMRGNASGTHSCIGDGWAQVRDAKIYELPPVVRLLNLMRVDDTAFDSGDISFGVNGENIDINRMEFNGDTISLIGNGRVNMNHDMDLNFYSVVGRNRLNIPLLSELYRRGSQKFMWIKVDGTFEEPRLSREMLPELNDSIRQLFQQPQR